jgi:hypothetical protein
MKQFYNTSTISSQKLHSVKEEKFNYNGSLVKLITVFNDSKGAIALVEDENGEVFEVAKDSLR